MFECVVYALRLILAGLWSDILCGLAAGGASRSAAELTELMAACFKAGILLWAFLISSRADLV